MENIVLLHGAMGAASDLENIAAALRKKGINPVLFSFAGHGGKTFGHDFGVRTFTLELSRFLEQSGLQSPHLFGYSMGGYIALKLAADGAFNGKIITLGTRIGWMPEPAEREAGLLVPEKMSEKIPAYTKMLAAKHGGNWEELAVKTAAMLRELGVHNYLQEEKLKSIANEVLFGIGDKDQMADAEETLKASRLIPNGAMYMLPRTKHQLESVNAGLLAEIITDFIHPG